jgi:homoserine dehydrogenase
VRIFCTRLPVAYFDIATKTTANKFCIRPTMNAQLIAPGHHAPTKNKALSRVDVVLIGARGKVGTAFREQLAGAQQRLCESIGLDISLLAAYDRHGFAFSLAGLSPDTIQDDFLARNDHDTQTLIQHLLSRKNLPAIVIDCTASDEIADLYPSLLAGGVAVVTANKRANSRSQDFYEALQHLALKNNTPYRYETTVGAAIPIVGPMQDLKWRGEKIQSVQGVLSGSLSYILYRLHQGIDFSQSVLEARELGYTEPDPFEDLSAQDLGRKLLVLAREAGFVIEPEDLKITPLLDAPKNNEALETTLKKHDASWRARIEAADARDERWVVLAEASHDEAKIGLQRVPLSSPFARLRPGQNLVRISTERQHAIPLELCGAGAGPEITAAGVLSDVILAARQLAI